MPDRVSSVIFFAGLKFSHYRINEEIGSGGRGVVSHAYPEWLDSIAIIGRRSVRLAVATCQDLFLKKYTLDAPLHIFTDLLSANSYLKARMAGLKFSFRP